jgi:RNA polymerase sigma-70 factor (ECF subfamily)
MELWRRAQAGDREAFQELATSVWPLLFRALLPYLEDRQATEDVAQEALLRAWQALPSFRGDSRVETWIVAIGFNLARNQRRRRLPEPRADLPEPTGPSPEDIVINREQWARLMAALQGLPPLWRTALLLVTRENLSYEEAAQILGCRTSTVRNWIHRARLRLRREVLEDGAGGERQAMGEPVMDT